MDKASDYESGDSRFESWQGRDILSHTKLDLYLIFTTINVYLKLMAQWIRQLTTDHGISGSSSSKVVIFCLILRYTLYLIFTAIIVYLKFVALWPNG